MNDVSLMFLKISQSIFWAQLFFYIHYSKCSKILKTSYLIMKDQSLYLIKQYNILANVIPTIEINLYCIVFVFSLFAKAPAYLYQE